MTISAFGMTPPPWSTTVPEIVAVVCARALDAQTIVATTKRREIPLDLFCISAPSGNLSGLVPGWGKYITGSPFREAPSLKSLPPTEPGQPRLRSAPTHLHKSADCAGPLTVPDDGSQAACR